MLDLGWTEMLVIAIVLIVVVGPKDLPKMLRTFGKTTSKLRGMAGDFRKQFDEALKEAELDDVKGIVDDVRKLNPTNEIKQALSPMQKAAADVRAGLDSAMKPKKPETAATPGVTKEGDKLVPATDQTPASTPKATEPLKTGATSNTLPVKPAANGKAVGTGAKKPVSPAKPTAAKPKAASASKAASPRGKSTAGSKAAGTKAAKPSTKGVKS